jgi:ligand-binding sensor domain-containing protein
VEAGRRLYAGTDGRGLWRLSADGARFEPLRLPLPSPRVSALASGEGALWIGTDEGLARLPLNDEEP